MPMCQPAYPRGDLSSSEQAGIVAQSPPNRNPVKMASDYAFRIMLIFRNPERNPTPSRLTVMQRTLGVGDRLTVGQRTLTPPVLVRIQLPQPNKINHLWPLRRPFSCRKCCVMSHFFARIPTIFQRLVFLCAT